MESESGGGIGCIWNDGFRASTEGGLKVTAFRNVVITQNSKRHESLFRIELQAVTKDGYKSMKMLNEQRKHRYWRKKLRGLYAGP